MNLTRKKKCLSRVELTSVECGNSRYILLQVSVRCAALRRLQPWTVIHSSAPRDSRLSATT